MLRSHAPGRARTGPLAACKPLQSDKTDRSGSFRGGRLEHAEINFVCRNQNVGTTCVPSCRLSKHCTSRLVKFERSNACSIEILQSVCRKTVFESTNLCERSITATSCVCWTPSARYGLLETSGTLSVKASTSACRL